MVICKGNNAIVEEPKNLKPGHAYDFGADRKAAEV